jgi:hypothetical protein
MNSYNYYFFGGDAYDMFMKVFNSNVKYVYWILGLQLNIKISTHPRATWKEWKF